MVYVVVTMDNAHHYLEPVVVWQVGIDCQMHYSDQTYIVAYWIVEGTPKCKQ